GIATRYDSAIYSRKELGGMMRRQAVDAGARLHCSRVENTRFANGKWRIETAAGDFTADFLIGADGASSVIRRRVGLKFEPKDFAYALGWHVKSDRIAPHVDVKYLDEFSGYLWLFPPPDHAPSRSATAFH